MVDVEDAGVEYERVVDQEAAHGTSRSALFYCGGSYGVASGAHAANQRCI